MESFEKERGSPIRSRCSDSDERLIVGGHSRSERDLVGLIRRSIECILGSVEAAEGMGRRRNRYPGLAVPIVPIQTLQSLPCRS